MIDDSLNVVAEADVNFDSDFPAYGTTGGGHKGDDGLTVTSPTIMWIEALETVLGKLKAQNLDFGKIKVSKRRQPALPLSHPSHSPQDPHVKRPRGPAI